MVNLSIYTIQVSNECAPVASEDVSLEAGLIRFNMNTIVNAWEKSKYFFQKTKNDALDQIPDISLVVGGALIFRENLKKSLFDNESALLEFLPIVVEGESWWLVNCLNFTDQYDKDESIFYRGLDGKIFAVRSLVINDTTLAESQMFVIDDSNRSTLFVTQQFVDKVSALKLRGIDFKKIGFFRSGS